MRLLQLNRWSGRDYKCTRPRVHHRRPRSWRPTSGPWLSMSISRHRESWASMGPVIAAIILAAYLHHGRVRQFWTVATWAVIRGERASNPDRETAAVRSARCAHPCAECPSSAGRPQGSAVLPTSPAPRLTSLVVAIPGRSVGGDGVDRTGLALGVAIAAGVVWPRRRRSDPFRAGASAVPRRSSSPRPRSVRSRAWIGDGSFLPPGSLINEMKDWRPFKAASVKATAAGGTAVRLRAAMKPT